MEGDHFVMFDGHWSSASGDMKCLICRVTSKKHMIEAYINFMGVYIGHVSSLWYISPPCQVCRP